MLKMTEEEFSKLTFESTPKECNHPHVVKLYYLGMHTDYACEKCGLQSTEIEHFNK